MLLDQVSSIFKTNLANRRSYRRGEERVRRGGIRRHAGCIRRPISVSLADAGVPPGSAEPSGKTLRRHNTVALRLRELQQNHRFRFLFGRFTSPLLRRVYGTFLKDRIAAHQLRRLNRSPGSDHQFQLHPSTQVHPFRQLRIARGCTRQHFPLEMLPPNNSAESQGQQQEGECSAAGRQYEAPPQSSESFAGWHKESHGRPKKCNAEKTAPAWASPRCW